MKSIKQNPTHVPVISYTFYINSLRAHGREIFYSETVAAAAFSADSRVIIIIIINLSIDPTVRTSTRAVLYNSSGIDNTASCRGRSGNKLMLPTFFQCLRV